MSESQTNLYEYDGYVCDGIENGCYLVHTPKGERVGLPIGQTEDEADFVAAVTKFQHDNP
jgi:hypothetical protein